MTTALEYQTLRVTADPDVLWITLDRPRQNNSINGTLLAELAAALGRAGQLPSCRMVVIQGAPGVFCTGMDFADVADASGSGDIADRGGTEFLALLKQITDLPRVVVSVVDGRVAGGGVGIAAASDFVYATPRSTFGLPEALWGLMPCCVLPFLIRRAGFQAAHTMSLSTLPVTAEAALACKLADGVDADPALLVRKLRQRVSKLDGTTIGDLKRYLQRLWFLSADMEQAAVSEFARLMSSPVVRDRITGFATSQVFPWEARS